MTDKQKIIVTLLAANIEKEGINELNQTFDQTVMPVLENLADKILKIK